MIRSFIIVAITFKHHPCHHHHRLEVEAVRLEVEKEGRGSTVLHTSSSFQFSYILHVTERRNKIERKQLASKRVRYIHSPIRHHCRFTGSSTKCFITNQHRSSLPPPPRRRCKSKSEQQRSTTLEERRTRHRSHRARLVRYLRLIFFRSSSK